MFLSDGNNAAESRSRMFAITGDCFYVFRPPKERTSGALPAVLPDDQTEEKIPDTGDHVLCRQCRHPITLLSEQISVQGSHRHTFANPHGIVFEIGCFGSAGGCAYTGPASDEFTWFAGFSWKIAVCGRCLTHLGWLFTSTGFSRFHGLILDRLAIQKQ